MSRTLQFMVFFSVALAVALAMHGYLWWRLVRDPSWGQPWSAVFTAMLVALLVAIPTAFVLWRVLPVPLVRWLLIATYFWLAMAFLMLVLLLAVDLVRLGGWIMQAIAPMGGWLSRHDNVVRLSRIVAVSVLGLSAALCTAGAWVAHRPPTVRRLEVTLARLHPAQSGFTLVQLSDLHLGPTLDRDWFAAVVEQVNDLAPDLVVITGDLADGMVDHMGEVVAPLGDLRAEHGVFFVTGNHEYYAGVEEWLPLIESLGTRVLRNERVSIGDGEASFDLAGIDDPDGARMMPGHGPDLGRALEGRDPTRELVLLAHQPRAVEEASRMGVGLQLSGHTHGGQIWPWSYLVYLQQPYVNGRFQHGATQLYVTSGTGYWGPPIRLGTRGEIVHVTLRSAVD